MRVPVCSAPDFTTTVPRAAFRCMLTWPDLAPVYAPCQMCCKHQPTMSIEIKRRNHEKGGNNKQQQQAGREKREARDSGLCKVGTVKVGVVGRFSSWD